MGKHSIIRDVVVPVALGLGAIAVGGLVIHKIVTAPLKAKEKELEMWIEEWNKEYDKYSADGVFTDEERDALEMKRGMIEKVSKELLAFGWTPEKIYGLFATIGVTVLGLYVGKKAVDYFLARVRKGEAKTVYGYIATMGSAMNIDLADKGYPTLASAAQTSLENWTYAFYIPAMQSEITMYQASIPYLTGMELLWAQYMVTALQFEMAVAIPALFAAAWLLIP